MSKKQKKDLLKIAVSLMFFVASFFTSKITIGTVSLSFVFSFIAFLVCGWNSVVRAIKNLVRLNPLDEHLLMSVASIGAFFIGEATEGAAVMVFYQIGELFQSIAVSKSRKSIAALADIAPDFACVLRDGEFVEVNPCEVLPGDELLIKAGERVPVDCVVLKGTSDIDTKAITGESMPVSVSAGNKIASGSINLSGVIYATAQSTYENSTVAKILELTEAVSSKKSTYESFIHRFALLYTPIVVCSALVLAIVPSLFLGNALEWIRRALTFLVISCPCALVISVPLAFFAGLGKASANGILIKGSNFIEALSQADTAVFDKTGTLTSGGFFVTEINLANMEKDALLQIVASAEIYSNHPIKDAVLKEYNGEFLPFKNTQELAGMGIVSEYDGGTVLIGNARLMEKYDVSYEKTSSWGTALYVAQDGIFLGSITVSDKIKENAKSALQKLRRVGIKKIVILTGDKKEAAQSVCDELLADEVMSELLPQDKVAAMEKIKNDAHGKVFFTGDGINDAPVMAMADVSISMGQIGQDAAIEASDIVLPDDNLDKIYSAIRISKKTVMTAKANIIFCIGVKILVLILGALGLTNIWAAVFADVGVCVVAVLNSVRLLSNKISIFSR